MHINLIDDYFEKKSRSKSRSRSNENSYEIIDQYLQEAKEEHKSKSKSRSNDSDISDIDYDFEYVEIPEEWILNNVDEPDSEEEFEMIEKEPDSLEEEFEIIEKERESKEEEEEYVDVGTEIEKDISKAEFGLICAEICEYLQRSVRDKKGIFTNENIVVMFNDKHSKDNIIMEKCLLITPFEVQGNDRKPRLLVCRIQQNEQKPCIIIACRGSVTKRDFLNLDMSVVFRNLHKHKETRWIIEKIQNYCEKKYRKRYNIIVTGHSLGGAFARLVFSNLRYCINQCVTFNKADTYKTDVQYDRHELHFICTSDVVTRGTNPRHPSVFVVQNTLPKQKFRHTLGWIINGLEQKLKILKGEIIEDYTRPKPKSMFNKSLSAFKNMSNRLW